jgi:hypothetical protein
MKTSSLLQKGQDLLFDGNALGGEKKLRLK